CGEGCEPDRLQSVHREGPGLGLPPPHDAAPAQANGQQHAHPHNHLTLDRPHDAPGAVSSLPGRGYFTAYSSETIPVFWYVFWPMRFSFPRFAGGGSSGIPPPSSTGTIATSTVSTNPSLTRLPKSEPPPKSQMSLPGSFFSASTVFF